jgi:FixJ family two-component response regulator
VIETALDGARLTLGNGHAVLVVDDDTDLRESLGDVLRAEGYAVTLASNGREAFDLLPGLRRPCAVVLDLAMPVMSGTEFYRAMSEVPSLADIPVAILTCDPGRAPIGLPKMVKTSVERLIAMVNGLFSRTKGPSRRAS